MSGMLQNGSHLDSGRGRPFVRPSIVASLVLFSAIDAHADEAGAQHLVPSNDPDEAAAACSHVEVRLVEKALKSKKDRTRQCVSLKAKRGDDFSYTQFMYGRYKARFTAGILLAGTGAAAAAVAIGLGVAWATTPQEETADGDWMFPEFHLSRRDQYRLATLILAPISLALLVTGITVTALAKPKMLRLKELTSETPMSFSRHPVLALEPYVDSHGAIGGQLVWVF